MRRALAGMLALGLAACSSSGGKSEEEDRTVSVAQAVCSKDAGAKRVPLPHGFPGAFPLPPGTVVYAADDRGPDTGIVVTGVTATPFASVLSALQKGLPVHHFHPDNGEVEPHDAESDWSSETYQGRWAIRELPQCPGDTLVNVVARRRKAG